MDLVENTMLRCQGGYKFLWNQCSNFLEPMFQNSMEPKFQSSKLGISIFIQVLHPLQAFPQNDFIDFLK